MDLFFLNKKFRGIFSSKEDSRLKLLARLHRFGDFLARPERHWRIRKAVAWDRIKFIRKIQPRIEFKYLHPRYLIKGLSTDERAMIFTHHYEFLKNKLSSALTVAILSKGVDLWAYDDAEGSHNIRLVFSHPTDNEGEFTLEYLYGSSLIYLMSFSFAPGSWAGRSEETIVLLTRIQGVAKDFEVVRQAMKDLRGLSAASLLMAALQGIALGIGARAILSVSAEAQVCQTDAPSSVFLNAYDKYLSEMGAERYSEKLFLINLPLVERPLDEVKSSNRSRVRFQRERKRDILESAKEVFSKSCIQSVSHAF